MSFPPQFNLPYCNPTVGFHSNLIKISFRFTSSLLTYLTKTAIISTTDTSIIDIIAADIINGEMKTSPSKPLSFLPLTPAVFHILLALSGGEQHGYHIMQMIQADTQGQFRMGPGTLYGTIKRMLNDGLIEETGHRPETTLDDERRRYYRLTGLGNKVAQAEAERLANLVSKARLRRLLPSAGPSEGA